MSLSQERSVNPAKFRLEVKSGEVRYYDKELQENVNIPVPFEFIVLDQLAAVGGWSDSDNSGYWSNEVKFVGKDELTVRTSKGVKDSGIWREIKSNSALAGAKYNTVIYLAHKSDNGLTISKMSLSGAALNAWIEFTQANRINNVKVVLSGFEEGKKGAVKYMIPVFEAVKMEDGEKEEAVELDRELQDYFKNYFNRDEVVESAPLDVPDNEIDLSEIPF